jgi:hypothetical protein
VVLTCLQEARVNLATVIGQYHARGVILLWRRPLCLCEMTADKAPRTGTVTTPELLSQNEIQCRVALAIGKSIFTWPPTRFLPMLPNGDTEKLVSGLLFFRQVPRQT